LITALFRSPLSPARLKTLSNPVASPKPTSPLASFLAPLPHCRFSGWAAATNLHISSGIPHLELECQFEDAFGGIVTASGTAVLAMLERDSTAVVPPDPEAHRRPDGDFRSI
jgi:hypothetical protein